ncbi:HU family DNA-binding protein [Desulfococcus sp.]|uniref:HU family DNA-binding protein n=1 Tax=Desulfococcus sp. TaxID=2025834 RepID=UPI0035932651
MTRTDLINKIAEDAGITKTAAAKAISALTDGITDALKEKDGKVVLIGFGTFSKVHREARTGRNPQTGKAIKIAARNVVKFSPGKKLKESI